jgi:hypothetical protein
MKRKQNRTLVFKPWMSIGFKLQTIVGQLFFLFHDWLEINILKIIPFSYQSIVKVMPQLSKFSILFSNNHQ